MTSRRTRLTYRLLSAFIAFTFSFTSILPPACAQSIASLNLPVPGTMVTPSAAFVPVLLKGITIHPENPLQFDFIVDSGNTRLQDQALRKEASKLFKYFLAALTVPEEELWVNLSPYEKDRVIPQGFGDTEMGRDLLAQDYLLKQLTASLMYPEKELGKKFWDKVYKKAREQYGTTEIPMDTFNKVWIVPEKAVIYEQGASAFVVDAHLKVMLDSDYMAQKLDPRSPMLDPRASSSIKHPASSIETEIIREVILPEIEKEVNEGKTFANLRQIYNASILAAWYKMNLKTSLLGQVYADQNKTKGVDTQDKEANQKIYNQYIEAFKKGVYSYIKEDYDPATQEIIPRKYFSGGTNLKVTDKASILRRAANGALSLILAGSLTGVPAMNAEAIVAKGLRPNAAEARAYQFAVNIVGLGPKADEDYITTVSNGTLVKSFSANPQAQDKNSLLVVQANNKESKITDELNDKFIEAAREGNISEVRNLLKKGVNIDTKTNTGRTALMIASYNGHINIVETLIKNGANVNAKMEEDWTALMLATYRGHNNIIEILIKNNAAIDARTDIGLTAMMIAAENGYVKIVETLIKNGAKVNLVDSEHGVSALIAAAKFGHADIVKILIKNGAELNAQMWLGMTALMTAASKGYNEIVDILLKNGANVNLTNIVGRTALIYATEGRHEKIVELLIDNKANVHTIATDGATALSIAINAGHVEIVELLLKHGAAVNAESMGGVTPLMLASYLGHVKVVKLLLEWGADANIELNGKTALDFAREKGHKEIIDLLKKAGVKNDRSSVESLDKNLELVMKDINRTIASSPIKIPENLATKAIAAAIAALTLCTGPGCGPGPDQKNQPPVAEQPPSEEVNVDQLIETVHKAYNTKSYDDVRAAREAIAKLGEIGEEKAVDALIKFLYIESDDFYLEHMGEYVSNALAVAGDPMAVPHLMNVAESELRYDTNIWITRYYAAVALKSFNVTTILDRIVSRMQKNRSTINSQSLATLVNTPLAGALKNLWPKSQKVVSVLLDELKKGNTGAVWLIYKDEFTAEALSAILSYINTLHAHGFDGYDSDSLYYHYKDNRFFDITENHNVFIELLERAKDDEKDVLRILFLTNQVTGEYITNAQLRDIVENKTVEREVTELLNKPEVTDALFALERMSPEALRQSVENIIWVQNNSYYRSVVDYGYLHLSTAAANGWRLLVEATRYWTIAQKSVATKLLLQEGDLPVINYVYTGGVEIDYPIVSSVTWSENDIPQLQELLKSPYPYFQVAAQKALDKINSGDLTVVSPSSSPVGEIKAEESEVGGIDLNPALLDLQIKTDGSGVPLPLPQQPILKMKIEGFIPVIINVVPIPNLPMFLGFADTRQDENTGINTTEKLKAREPEDLSLLN